MRTSINYLQKIIQVYLKVQRWFTCIQNNTRIVEYFQTYLHTVLVSCFYCIYYFSIKPFCQRRFFDFWCYWNKLFIELICNIFWIFNTIIVNFQWKYPTTGLTFTCPNFFVSIFIKKFQNTDVFFRLFDQGTYLIPYCAKFCTAHYHFNRLVLVSCFYCIYYFSIKPFWWLFTFNLMLFQM